MQLIVLIVTIFGYTNAFPTPTLKGNVIWVRPTQPVVPAVKRRIKQKFMQKSHFRINSPLRTSQTHRPQRNFGSGMRTVRPAQLVVPVAEEYRSRV